MAAEEVGGLCFVGVAGGDIECDLRHLLIAYDERDSI